MQEEQNDRDRQHCFIVRVDGRLDDAIKSHKRRLERRRRGKVALAEAARDLFYQALGFGPKTPPKAHPSQLGLFGRRGPGPRDGARADGVALSEASSPRESVNCGHCGDPMPSGKRRHALYCSPSCRSLASRARTHE
jgi:hypothetical protein